MSTAETARRHPGFTALPVDGRKKLSYTHREGRRPSDRPRHRLSTKGGIVIRLLLAVFLCLAIIPAVTVAQVIEIHVYHDSNPGATASQFRVELQSSAVWLGDNWNFTHIGTSIEGISLSYGGCISAPTYLGYIQVFVTSQENICTDVRIVGDPASPSGQVEVVDCSYVVTYPGPWAIRLDYDPCRVPAPGSMEPPDGVVGVELNPTLVWTWDGNHNCPEGLGIARFNVFLGAAGADLERVGGVLPWDNGPPHTVHFPVGPLEPLTQYEWRVRVTDDYWLCPGFNQTWSPVYGFTTGGDVPVEKTTWGRIKDMYH